MNRMSSSSSSSPPPAGSAGLRLRVLPLHDIPVANRDAGVVRRGRGRPKKIVPAPSHDELAYRQQRSEERARHEAADPLLLALKDGKRNEEVVHVAMVELARESASLLWDRLRAQEKGVDAAQMCTRRIDALGKLVAIVLDLQRVGETEMFASAATVRKLKDVWLGTVRSVVVELLPPPEGERLLDAYERRLATAEVFEQDDGKEIQ